LVKRNGGHKKVGWERGRCGCEGSEKLGGTHNLGEGEVEKKCAWSTEKNSTSKAPTQKPAGAESVVERGVGTQGRKTLGGGG